MEDIREECGKFGEVKSIEIPRPVPGWCQAAERSHRVRQPLGLPGRQLSLLGRSSPTVLWSPVTHNPEKYHAASTEVFEKGAEVEFLGNKGGKELVVVNFFRFVATKFCYLWHGL